MTDNNVNDQQAEVVQMNEPKPKQKVKANGATGPATAPQQAPQEAQFLISETAVNQLLNTIAELPGLTWKQTNPIIAHIQQSVKRFQG